MFDEMAFRGLMSRFAKKLMVLSGNPDEEPDAVMSFLAVTVAAVNYPEGASKFIEENAPDSPLPISPIISQDEIKRVTENCVDKDITSVNQMFQSIWGVNVPEYIAKLKED